MRCMQCSSKHPCLGEGVGAKCTTYLLWRRGQHERLHTHPPVVSCWWRQAEAGQGRQQHKKFFFRMCIYLFIYVFGQDPHLPQFHGSIMRRGNLAIGTISIFFLASILTISLIWICMLCFPRNTILLELLMNQEITRSEQEKKKKQSLVCMCTRVCVLAHGACAHSSLTFYSSINVLSMSKEHIMCEKDILCYCATVLFVYH